jgi:polar amino acid transport system substrate-binding protein
MGVTLVKQPINWDAKEMELDGGKIDCIWNGMTITDERVEAMFIPKAYVANAQIVIVPEGSDVTTVAGMEGKKVGLQKGSSALEALQGNAVYEKVGEVIEYEDNVTCYLDLKAGRVDAMVVDEIVGRYLIETE